MKNTKKKMIIAVILLLLGIGITQGFALLAELVYYGAIYGSKSVERKIASLTETVGTIDVMEDEAMQSFLANHRDYVTVCAGLLKNSLSEVPEENIRRFSEGFTFQIDEAGNYIFPDSIVSQFGQQFAENVKNELKTNPDLLQGPSSVEVPEGSQMNREFGTRYLFLSPIGNSYYYGETADARQLSSFMFSRVDVEEIMRSVEEAYGIEFVLLHNTDENDNVSVDKIHYVSPSLRETIYAYDGRPAIDAVNSLSGATGDIYKIYKAGEHDLLIAGNASQRAAALVGSDVGLMTMMIFLLGIVMIVWVISVYRFVRDHTLSNEQRARYNPQRVRLIVMSFVVLSALFCFLEISFFRALNNLQSAVEDCDSILDVLAYRIRTTEANRMILDLVDSDDRRMLGSRIAELIERDPAIMTKENLQMAAEQTGSDSITVFDHEGQEIVSSTDLIHLSLGKDENDPTSVFRRLLKGHDSVSASDVPYFDKGQTGTCSVTGVRLSLPEGGYGAILIGSLPRDSSATMNTNVNMIMTSMREDNAVMLAVNPETQTVVYSSNDELIGNNAVNLGISDKKQKDNAKDFYRLEGIKYYGCSALIDGLYYYYMVPESSIYEDVIGFSSANSINVLFVLGIVGFYLLMGYNRKTFEENSVIGDRKEFMKYKLVETTYLRRRLRNAKKEKFSLKKYWSDSSPEQKAMLVFIVILGYEIFRIMRRFVISNELSGNSIFAFLMRGDWTRGLNLFSITSVIVLGVSIAVIFFIMQIISRLLQNILDSRGETICRLVLNLIRYLSFLVFLYYSLSYLGVDTQTLLVGAGIVGFAITLGARDLVTDLLSGLLIVFEGDFRVGDIIEIGGFRGTVLEIGVRSTKILGRGGNIKTIANREVKNTLNLTRMNSLYTLEVKIPASISLTDVEAMLEKELPEISKRIPEMVGDIQYKGVTAISGNSVTLALAAECDEEDFMTVQQKVNKEVFLLFKTHDILI